MVKSTPGFRITSSPDADWGGGRVLPGGRESKGGGREGEEGGRETVDSVDAVGPGAVRRSAL